MDIGALLLGAISLVLALLEARKRTAPARERAQRDEAVDADFHAMDRAITARDAAGLAAAFERERRETLKRVAPRDPADGRLP